MVSYNRLSQCAFVLAAAFSLGSCESEVKIGAPSSRVQVFKVDSVNFCVPEEYVVEDVPWYQSGKEDDGFAFRGCWSANPNTQAICDFSVRIRGGIVHKKGLYSKKSLRDFNVENLYGKLAREKSSVLERGANGLMLVRNGSISSDWLIFSTHTQAVEADYQLSENDVVEAICEKVEKIPYIKHHGSRDAMFCSRNVQFDDYSIDYEFETFDEIPQDLEWMDTSVIQGIESFRCDTQKKD